MARSSHEMAKLRALIIIVHSGPQTEYEYDMANLLEWTFLEVLSCS